MDEHEWLAAQFEAERPHLRAVAYRMLGSLSEADDHMSSSASRSRAARSSPSTYLPTPSASASSTW